MGESKIVKMPFVGYGTTEEAAMIRFWRTVRSYEAEHQLMCLQAEIIVLGKDVYRHNEHGLDSNYAAGYGLFSKLRE